MTRKAPRKYVAWITAGLPALLLAGSASAANDIQPPSLEPVSHTEGPLREILDSNATAPALRTLDAADVDEKIADGTDEAALRNAEIPDIATRPPSATASHLPRFRRHMYRTDI